MLFSPRLQDYLAFAERLADCARIHTMTGFREPLVIENKASEGVFDPVTLADRGAEMAMRAQIEAAYPDHGIIGEENEAKPAQSAYSWVLDPIDGTRAYVCGLPSWGSLIALCENGQPIVGVIDLPDVQQLYRGWPGGADVREGEAARPLQVSGSTRLAGARISTTDPYLFTPSEADAFTALRGQALLCRYGLDCSAYAALAAGGLDLVIESGLKVYDVAAIIPVIEGAGGLVRSWDGGPAWQGGQVIAAANGTLLDEALAILAPAARKPL